MAPDLFVSSESETRLFEGLSDNKQEKFSKKRKQLLWTNEENEVYVKFLKTHREFFKNEKIRRKQKIFIQFAELVNNRSAEQCRSHHQRMMISHKSISKIIKYLEMNQERERKNLNHDQKLQSASNLDNRTETNSESSNFISQDPQMRQQQEKKGKEQRELWNLINVEFWYEK